MPAKLSKNQEGMVEITDDFEGGARDHYQGRARN